MDEEMHETADLICSLHAKKLALMFFGRREEFMKFMSDAFDSNDMTEDKVLEEFFQISLKINLIEKMGK